MTPLQPDADEAELASILARLREALKSLAFPLEFARAPQARSDAAAVAAQLDDYILPRLASLDAPLLAVVGGSTGAGKSTLVNALVGHPVTRSGAIRPTTRQPILLHHPAEGHWFAGSRVLPSLSRERAVVIETDNPLGIPADQVGTATDSAGAGTMMLIPDPMVPRGLAVLDAPDVDSIADENRRLAGQLLAAADLWLFVTTANRYADAVPWELLRNAAGRDILVAVVLDRVPDGVAEEVRADLHTLLAAEELGHAPIFLVPEVKLDTLGMLPEETVDPIRRWLQAISADAEGRREIARRTLDGAVRSLGGRLSGLAASARSQQETADMLENGASEAYDGALAAILESTGDGTLLRGEVLARWQDFVGTGEFMRALESRIGQLRDRIGGYLTGRPPRVATVETAIESGLQNVIVEESAKAAAATDRIWRGDSAGRVLLPERAPADVFPAETARQIRAWQKDLVDLVRAEGANKRFAARMLSFGVNGVAVALMIVVFASTAGLSGGEVLIAGGSAVVGQKLLEAIFGEEAVRKLARTARDQLRRRCEAMLAVEKSRYTDLLVPLRGETSADDLLSLSRELTSLEDATPVDPAERPDGPW